jgi:hypothetical protein
MNKMPKNAMNKAAKTNPALDEIKAQGLTSGLVGCSVVASQKVFDVGFFLGLFFCFLAFLNTELPLLRNAPKFSNKINY